MLTHTQHTEQRGSFSSQTTQSTNTFLHTHSNTTVHSKQAHKDTDTTHKQATAQGIQYKHFTYNNCFHKHRHHGGTNIFDWADIYSMYT